MSAFHWKFDKFGGIKLKCTNLFTFLLQCVIFFFLDLGKGFATKFNDFAVVQSLWSLFKERVDWNINEVV